VSHINSSGSGMVGGINIPYVLFSIPTRYWLTVISFSGSEMIEAYSSAAANVQQAETPGQLRGGQLLDDTQIASLSSSASLGSASAT
jgi:hypothetical protein